MEEERLRSGGSAGARGRAHRHHRAGHPHYGAHGHNAADPYGGQFSSRRRRDFLGYYKLLGLLEEEGANNDGELPEVRCLNVSTEPQRMKCGFIEVTAAGAVRGRESKQRKLVNVGNGWVVVTFGCMLPKPALTSIRPFHILTKATLNPSPPADHHGAGQGGVQVGSPAAAPGPRAGGVHRAGACACTHHGLQAACVWLHAACLCYAPDWFMRAHRHGMCMHHSSQTNLPACLLHAQAEGGDTEAQREAAIRFHKLQVGFGMVGG